MRNPVFDRDRSSLTTQLLPIFLFLLLFAVLIGGRMLYLHVFLGDQLTKQSEENRIRHEMIPAQRGIITDRDGEVLAADEPVFHLRKQARALSFPPRQINELARGLNLSTDVLRERLESKNRRYILRGMTDVQRIWFAEQAERFSELNVRIQPRRVYHHGSVIAPVVGYTGEINPGELRGRRGEGLSQGSIVGKTGIEKYYDRRLQGQSGMRWIEVSADGEHLRTLESPSPTEPRDGDRLRLNLDLDLQRRVAHSFPSDSAGAAVVMEVPSGEVRALYSHPTFDPGELTIAGTERINQLLRAEGDPLHNRAVQSRFPPGSTFKIFPFLSALSSNRVDPGRQYDCDGEFQLGTQTYRCWEEDGHGSLNLIQGLVYSCNVYFYNLVTDLGWGPIMETAEQFRFSRRSGIDLPDESISQLSSPVLKQTRYGRQWVEGDAVNAVIGQGYTLVSPIKQAQLMGKVVTGREVRPSVAEPAEDPPETIPSYSSGDRQTLLGTLDRVTDVGTGYWAQHDTSYRVIEPEVIGKTGTVQKIKRDDEEDTPPSDAWFVSAAPADDPSHVVVVFRIEGGTGGSVAAPHAREIYQDMAELDYFTTKGDSPADHRGSPIDEDVIRQDDDRGVTN